LHRTTSAREGDSADDLGEDAALKELTTSDLNRSDTRNLFPEAIDFISNATFTKKWVRKILQRFFPLVFVDVLTTPSST
jgi:hypothetical protein